jgi:ketosteroid isomerase-like protein
MYRRQVERKLREAFAGLSQGRPEAVTSALSKSAVHFFIGAHALSGTRRTPDAIARWYGRLLRLLPEIRFDLNRIEIAGPPWRTLAVVSWNESNTGADGVPTRNSGVNVLEIAWGQVTGVRIYTDTTTLQRTLDRLAAAGVAEAHAAPIEA